MTRMEEMGTLVLGFCGRARHGKDSAAEAIREYCNEYVISCRVYSASDVIVKDCVEQGLLLPGTRRSDLTTREELDILVRVSHERRAEDPEYWHKRLQAKMEADAFEVAIIPNLRYLNDCTWLKSLGGHLISVLRLNRDPERNIYLSPDRDPNDDTETDSWLMPADFFLTACSGDEALIGEQAITLFLYIQGLRRTLQFPIL